jgi:hypothetical protein
MSYYKIFAPFTGHILNRNGEFIPFSVPVGEYLALAKTAGYYILKMGNNEVVINMNPVTKLPFENLGDLPLVITDGESGGKLSFFNEKGFLPKELRKFQWLFYLIIGTILYFIFKK